MSQEHYYAVQTFLQDDELHKIWNIIEHAMNRDGYDVSNSELSLRLYDSELTETIEHEMVYAIRQITKDGWKTVYFFVYSSIA